MRLCENREVIVEGDNGGNVMMLGYVLYMYGFILDVMIVDVMDIRGELLCFEYD